ncbi:heterokaryon incompatibility protein-domain-containing protein [Xylaria scruposa]|nr:heterokaryon incompatibility protein-domain-containing protein [Xylaria scruposa]
MKQHKYRYQALPGDGGSHIRITTIHPAAYLDDDIHVSLRVEEFRVADGSFPDNRLHKVPSYEAMSYCWGAEGDDGHIFVRNDVARPGPSGRHDSDGGEGAWLPARANLLSALRHLRRKTEPRDMWIDAICIDQDDVVQKGPQVALMGTLYSRAAAVVVRRPTPPPANRDVPFDCRGADSLAVYHLFCRDWFERLWVRQEIGLAAAEAARVQCGSAVVPWRVFRNAWGALHNKHTADEDAGFQARMEDRLSQLYGILSQAPVIWLTWVWETCAEARCSDARDRIYAIRSLLADDDVKRAIKPDYTKTTVEVYQHTTMAFLRGDSDRDLGILEECHQHPDWQGPSWVPDWSHPLHTVVALGKKRPSCNLLPRFRVWELVAPSVLRIRGVVVAEVACVYSLPSLGDVRAMLEGDPRAMDDPYPAGGTVLEAYGRALCDGRFTHNDLSVRAARRPDFAAVCDQLIQLLRGREMGTSTEMETETPSWMKRMLTGRALLRTTSGLVGLAENLPGSFEPGDQVCAVFGCKHLLALGPLRGSDNDDEQGAQRYRLRGYCHLEGADFGEAVLGPLPPSIRPVMAELMMPDGKRLSWVFQDTRTGEVIREDPRLIFLGIDMAEYREALECDNLPWLRVDPEVLEERLAARGVLIQTLDLV